MPNSEATPKINYGGQAVIEGVMMRGTQVVAIGVRNPEDDIVMHVEPLDQRIYGSRLGKTPFLRGLVMLWDALGLGIKALMWSADVALAEEGEDPEESAFSKPAQWGTVALSLSFSIALFFLLPAFLGEWLAAWLAWGPEHLVSNIIEGAARLGLLVGYIALIGQMEDIQRLFGYHGAEHKTINAYEADAPLTPESVAQFPLEHPRCGTAFLLTVVVISILFFTLVPDLGLLARLISRLLLLPVVAGVAYELLRFSAANQDKAVVRWMTRPNMALQRLTTREPDRGMLEVAIAAFEQVVAYERRQAVPITAVPVPDVTPT